MTIVSTPNVNKGHDIDCHGNINHMCIRTLETIHAKIQFEYKRATL